MRLEPVWCTFIDCSAVPKPSPTGISPGQLRGPRFRRLMRDVYVDARVPVTPALEAEAALRCHPKSAWVSHQTAATIQGIPMPHVETTHVSVPTAGERRRNPGVTCHVGHRTSVRLAQGMPCSTGLALFTELASQLGLVDLVIAGDAMLRAELMSLSEVQRHCRGLRRGHPVRRAGELVRARVDSPMETRVRLLIVFAGLPEPEVGLVLRNDLGDVIRQVDLAYPKWRIAIEYQGKAFHRDDLDGWDSDIEKRENYATNDWRVIEVVARDVYRRPAHLLRRIAARIEECGGGVHPVGKGWRELDMWRS